MTVADIDSRRRRAAYRAAHRGTKEMDWLVGRFADAHLARMAEEELGRFERLLELPDPELQRWILDGAQGASEEHASLIAAMRTFHGLGGGS